MLTRYVYPSRVKVIFLVTSPIVARNNMNDLQIES